MGDSLSLTSFLVLESCLRVFHKQLLNMFSSSRRLALRALSRNPARAMSTFRATTPVMGGDGHPQHFLDIAYKTKNEEHDRKLPFVLSLSCHVWVVLQYTHYDDVLLLT